ncbi:patatin-domain-containing protein [Daedalea quercina L-15889]|uniref:Patatin-like phospholipase domain-containing protein n=1 Tax=Daedalea quercina L-15889 TaxID=1314783 RepID=A0A165MRE8_9APHY|nr:patatin-domain-containing protein [Daedalea quercina L-15889]
MSPGPRVRKISALSDFAPVNVKVKKRRKPSQTQHKRQEWLYILVRWPLLGLIFLFISVEFGMYILIRQMVNAKEWLSAWRGRKGLLRQRLRSAQTYQEWKDAALVLDEYLRFDEWKHIDEDPFYDWRLVRKVRRSLKALRERGDARGLVGVLETCLRTNFAGVESSSETFYGTKDLIEDYVNEEEKALEFVRESTELSNDEKRRFFKSVNTNLGTSALCLSGGASFGYYHFGIVKAFLDAGLMPRVISGTSAGGVVAAMACTRTDGELRRLLTPDLAKRLTAFEEPFQLWFKRFWSTGARFDAVQWARKLCFFTRGSMTFREAYNRTGRILNISVVPADRHSPTKLLNYMTAPDTVIWSALLASAAVPGILDPVVLMQKLKDGTIVPWNWGSKFKDGSLRVDIPVQALNLYFNVTHPIVSQVNPHVHLFFFAPQGSAGKPVAHRKNKGWRGNFLLSAGEQWLKLELTKNFKLIRDLDLLPQLLGQDWSSVFLQRFEGSDWLHILSDPDETELTRMLHVGQLVTWPKLHMIKNRFRLEQQIFLGRQAVRKAMQARGQAARRGEVAPQGRIPEPNTGTRLPVVGGTPVVSTLSEGPLPMDTDAEAAYLLRAQREEQRNAAPAAAPGPSPGAGMPEARRAPGRRRRVQNVVEQFGKEAARDEDRGGALPDPPPAPQPGEREQQQAHAQVRQTSSSPASPVGFLRKLGTGSPFSTFASLRGKNKSKATDLLQEGGEGTWSGDSSSDDDDLSIISRRQRHPPTFDIRSDFERRYSQVAEEDDDY